MGNTSSIPAFFILSLVPKHCPNLLAPLCGAAIKESQGIEQHCHSEPVLFPGVGISIELQTTHRHTGCSILPFSGVHPREVVLLSGRLPRQESELARNDRKVGNPPNSNSSLRPVISLNHFIKPGIGCQPGSAS